jgi:hypothetical protein
VPRTAGLHTAILAKGALGSPLARSIMY